VMLRDMGDSLAVALMPEELPAGEVLTLRRWTASKIDQLLDSIEASQPELARWLPWADPMPTRTVELEVVTSAERAFVEDRDYAFFLIERASGDLVGCAGLHPKTGGVVEIGYWVRSDRTRRGYATLAAGSLCRAAFTHLPEVEKVIIRMDQGNAASASIPRKLGFSLDGEEAFRDALTSGQTGKGWIWSTRRTSDPAA
jgi:RimJ/RimL family protein N-acetyltransferase